MEEGKEIEPPAERRFSSSSSQDFRTAVEATVAENTRKANDQWLRCFQQCCAEKKISIDLCSSSVEEIASVLERFYLEVRKQGGEPYGRSTLLCCRAALGRVITGAGRQVNIMQDAAFTTANKALDGLLKLRRKTGELKPTSHNLQF